MLKKIRNAVIFFTFILLQSSCITTINEALPNELSAEQYSISVKRQKTKKSGLVLGGGGARGIAHLAVIEALVKHNIFHRYNCRL